MAESTCCSPVTFERPYENCVHMDHVHMCTCTGRYNHTMSYSKPAMDEAAAIDREFHEFFLTAKAKASRVTACVRPRGVFVVVRCVPLSASLCVCLPARCSCVASPRWALSGGTPRRRASRPR
jgi:hypothetical protein